MSMQILLVEDSPTQALRLRLILERDGLKVSVARDGREGLRMAPVLLPDTVVLDVNLPDLDGFQVCQALKDHPATHGTPVIMLTVKDRAADTLAGLDAGADAYIPKDEFAEYNLRQTLRDMGIL
jgi:DNA-binding response OmpR family regulator